MPMQKTVTRAASRVQRAALFAALGVVSGVASAAPVAIDTTDVLTQMDNGQTAMVAVGGAILVLAAVSMAFRWVKATFF